MRVRQGREESLIVVARDEGTVVGTPVFTVPPSPSTLPQMFRSFGSFFSLTMQPTSSRITWSGYRQSVECCTTQVDNDDVLWGSTRGMGCSRPRYSSVKRENVGFCGDVLESCRAQK